ncbi:MAG: hypothetical protein V1781_05395 [Bacteroidota bacterium]
MKKSQRTGVSTFASRTSPSTDQSLQKSFHFSNPRKIELKKNSFPSENKKYTTAQADTDRHKSIMTMTRKLNIDNGFQGQKKERQLVTGGCCQWRDSGSFDSDVFIESFVPRGKFSGKIATEQQPPNRYGQVYETT